MIPQPDDLEQPLPNGKYVYPHAGKVEVYTKHAEALPIGTTISRDTIVTRVDEGKTTWYRRTGEGDSLALQPLAQGGLYQVGDKEVVIVDELETRPGTKTLRPHTIIYEKDGTYVLDEGLAMYRDGKWEDIRHETVNTPLDFEIGTTHIHITQE